MPVCPRCHQTFPKGVHYCPRDGAPLGASSADEILAERYRVVAPIAEGGMGLVFRVDHIHLGRPFALKFLAREHLTNAEAVRRFQREAQLTSRLQHPNLVQVTDFGRTHDGQPYLVMELIEGTDLRTMVRRDGPMQLSRVRWMVRQVAHALQYAHENGVIHRDLKAANIMVIEQPEVEPQVKIVDFGISKGVGPNETSLTMAGTVLGTPEYMSPEQISGKPIDARTDIYALGIVIYELLSGAVPFTGTPTAVMTAHLTTAIPPLHERRPDLPRALESVMAKALTKDANERFESMKDFALAFDRATRPAEELGVHEAATRQMTALGGAPTGASRPPVLAWAVAALAIAGCIALAILYLMREPPTRPRPRVVTRIATPKKDEALARAAALVAKGDNAAAEQALRKSVSATGACLRAALYSAVGAPARAVKEARRCIAHDPRQKRDPALARAVVQGLASSEKKRAFKLLIGVLAAAARHPILDAARDDNAKIRDAAEDVAKKLGLMKSFDLGAKWLLDLRQSKKCTARRKLVLKLVERRDLRALRFIERELTRPKKEIACYDKKVKKAVGSLRRLAASP